MQQNRGADQWPVDGGFERRQYADQRRPSFDACSFDWLKLEARARSASKISQKIELRISFGAELITSRQCDTFSISAGALTGQGSSRKILDTCGTANYGQCGGLRCQGPWQCADAAVGCCPSGFSCSRQSEWYWQCLPSNNSTPTTTSVAVSTATSAPTPTPTPAVIPAQTISAVDATGERSRQADCDMRTRLQSL